MVREDFVTKAGAGAVVRTGEGEQPLFVALIRIRVLNWAGDEVARMEVPLREAVLVGLSQIADQLGVSVSRLRLVFGEREMEGASLFSSYVGLQDWSSVQLTVLSEEIFFPEDSNFTKMRADYTENSKLSRAVLLRGHRYFILHRIDKNAKNDGALLVGVWMDHPEKTTLAASIGPGGSNGGFGYCPGRTSLVLCGAGGAAPGPRPHQPQVRLPRPFHRGRPLPRRPPIPALPRPLSALQRHRGAGTALFL